MATQLLDPPPHRQIARIRISGSVDDLLPGSNRLTLVSNRIIERTGILGAIEQAIAHCRGNALRMIPRQAHQDSQVNHVRVELLAPPRADRKSVVEGKKLD